MSTYKIVKEMDDEVSFTREHGLSGYTLLTYLYPNITLL